MARSNFVYNRAAVSVIIDGVAGSDFADDFAFSVTFPDDLSSVTVGLDKASISMSANKTVELEVKYKVTSPVNDIFFKLYQNQNNGQGRLFNITSNTGVDETLSFNNCAIKGFEGLEAGGAEMVNRLCRLTVQEFSPDASLY